MKVQLGTIEVPDEQRRAIRMRNGKKGLATRAEILAAVTEAASDALARSPESPQEPPADAVAGFPLGHLSRLQRAVRAAWDADSTQPLAAVLGICGRKPPEDSR